MSKGLLQYILLIGVSCAPVVVSAQEKAVEVSRCELAGNPKAFDGKRVRVRGRLNVYFEDFSLSTRDCKPDEGIWLAFGGDVPGIVASTWNDTYRKAGVDIEVKGISCGIRKDDDFHRLYALIASRHGEKPDYKVTATLTGMFFAVEESKDAKGIVARSGYGHVGCCSLLVITEVSEVESVPPANLRLDGVVIGTDGKPVEGFTVIDDVLGGSPPERQMTVTNSKGEFAFSNSGQQLRIEDPKYRPLALTVDPGGAPVRVVLEDAKNSDWVIPACAGANSGSRIGFAVLFAIPQTMESSRPADTDDTQSFFVYPKGEDSATAELFVSHSVDETKDADDSLDSKWFEERWAKDGAGNVVGMDARFQTENGYWRRVVFWNDDIAVYALRPGERPDILDHIIDSACLAETPRH